MPNTHFLRRYGLAAAVALFAAKAPAEFLPCSGDCGDDGVVTVDEIVRAVNIALGNIPVSECPIADGNGDNAVTVDEILRGLDSAINGCIQGNATPTSTPTPTPTPTPSPSDIQNPPVTAIALREWLRAGIYKSWTAESAIHPSGGPHGGTVRTYLNDIAIESLAAGNAQHPRGTALVKELYFGTPEVREWAVEIKLEDDSDGGRNWYWYEGVGLSGRGLGICTNCHGRDFNEFESRDYVLTPFPLQ